VRQTGEEALAGLAPRRPGRQARSSLVELLQCSPSSIPDGPIAVEVLRVIGAAMAKVGVVGLGRLTLSRRERMVVMEPRGTGMGAVYVARLQVKFGYRNSAAPRAISMPRWWQSRVVSSGSGPAISTPSTYRDRYPGGVAAAD